jgi:hypothetical protein
MADCFGRLVPLSEWQEYQREVLKGPEDYCPRVVCGAGRTKESA